MGFKDQQSHHSYTSEKIVKVTKRQNLSRESSCYGF
jgi:hypothetical protein